MTKRYVVSLGIMMVTVVVSLMIVSTLTYSFKWQADKAMVGIIVTYILAGFMGGVFVGKDGERTIRRNVIEAGGLSFLFLLFLVLCSGLGFHIPFEFTIRVFLIWLLIACGTFGGMHLCKCFVVKHR